MRRTSTLVTLLATLTLAACGGGSPTPFANPSANGTIAPSAVASSAATATPTANATPSPTLASATPIASASPAQITAWATDICAAERAFSDRNVQIYSDHPDPDQADRTLETVQFVFAARRDLIKANEAQTVGALNEVPQYVGGEAFRVALAAEIQDELVTLDSFYDAVAAATSLEQLDQLAAEHNAPATGRLFAAARAVDQIDRGFSDAIAEVTEGCRFFELDARARSTDQPTYNFTETLLDETFDEAGKFHPHAFEGGEVQFTDGNLVMAFTTPGAINIESTKGHNPESYHDVRVEATYTMTGSILAGLSCRDTGDKRYWVVVNPIGLILINRTGDSQLIGRHFAPEGFDQAQDINLAIECVDGNLDPFRLVVYLNGERVAEVTDQSTLSADGYAGMWGQGLGGGGSAAFQTFKVLVPQE